MATEQLKIYGLYRYYSECLFNESKVNTFVNVQKDKEAEVLKLHGNERVLSSGEPSILFPEQQAELTKFLIKRTANRDKTLYYTYLYLKGNFKGREINAPLLYSPVSLERVGTSVYINVDNTDIDLNYGLLMMLCPSEDIIQPLADDINGIVSQGYTENTVEAILNVITSVYPPSIIDTVGSCDVASVRLSREKALVLTKPPKEVQSILMDLYNMEDESVNNSALSAVESVLDLSKTHPSTPDNIITASVCKLDSSQFEVVEKAKENKILAVVGAPGTGKTQTIVGLATTYISNGYKVLIASKSKSAVNVIAGKMPSVYQTHNYYFNLVDKEAINKSADNIKLVVDGKLTGGKQDRVCEQPLNALKDYRELKEELIKIHNEVSEKSQGYWKCKSYGYKTLFKQWMLKLELDKLSAKEEMLNELLETRHDVIKYAPSWALQNRCDELFELFCFTPAGRRTAINFEKHIRKGIVSPELFLDTLRYIPCWLATPSQASTYIPLEAGLFDIVIIDEASQCDIASCLPLLFRAKRAVVVGDNSQLKFISFLDNKKNQSALALADIANLHKLTLDFRANSMFDFAQYFATTAPMLLEYYYRGTAGLINFASNKFYNGRIKAVKQSKQSQGHKKVRVNGSISNKGKTENIEEAKAILAKVKEIVANGTIEGDITIPSIGILSPFRAQCQLIQKLIDTHFTQAEIDKHRITVGTAHVFQGNEKDIMLISWAVSDNAKIQSHTFLNNPNLFNVAITRAKEVCISYYSMDENNMPKGILREFLGKTETI